MQATLHHPAAEQRDSQSSPTQPTADDNHDHHDGHHEDRQRPAPSRPEAHQREAAVEGLISLSQLPPRMSSPSPPLRPLPPRKRKSPPLHHHPQQRRQRHSQQQQQQQQQGARPGQPLPLPSDTSQSPPAAAAARAPAYAPAVRSPPPPPPLPALGRVVAPYLTRGGAPTSPPPPRPSSTATTMVAPLMAPLPPLKRLRSIATARLLPPEAISFTSTSTTSPTTAPMTTAAPAAIAPASTASTTTAHEALRTASVAFLDGHHVAPPPPQPSSSPPPPPPPSSPAEETARHLCVPRRRRRSRDEDYEDSEYDQDYQDDDHDDDEEEEEEEEEAPSLIMTRAATAPQLAGLAAGFGGGGGEDEGGAGAEERERRAVERCLDLGVERNVVEALSTAGVSAERIVELILSEDKEQREGIIRGTGLSKNYIMKLQRRALRTSAHLQLPSPLAHSFRSGLVLHVLFDSHDRALFIKKELCRLLNMKGTTFSYWKKKAGVSDIDTSQDFRLMDKCRSIFGGRSTYTLYSAEQMLTILQCMQRSRQKNCFTNVPELTALIASYHPQHQHQHYPSSTLLPLLPALAGQPCHDSGGVLRAIDAAGHDHDHDHDHLQQEQREKKKEAEARDTAAKTAAAAATLPYACPAATDLLSGRTTTTTTTPPSPPSPAGAPLTTTPAAGPATDNGHFTAADPR